MASSASRRFQHRVWINDARSAPSAPAVWRAFWEDPDLGVRDEHYGFATLAEALSWARDRSDHVLLNLREQMCWLGPGASPVDDAFICDHPEHRGI